MGRRRRDVADECLANRVEDRARLRRVVHLLDSIERGLEAAGHIDAVVAIGNLAVEIRQVIFLGDDRRGNCIECVFDSGHMKNSFLSSTDIVMIIYTNDTIL